MAEDTKSPNPILVGIAGVVALVAARKVADMVWVAVTGREAPQAENPDESFPLIAGFAVLTASSVAIAQAALRHRVAIRKARAS